MLTDDIRKKALNVSPRAKQCPVGMDLAALGKKWTFHILRSIGISHIDRWCRAYLRLQRPRNCRSEGGILMPSGESGESEILERLKRDGSILPYETRLTRKDGASIDVSLSVTSVSDPTGRTIGASILIQDISEKKLRRLSSKGQART